MSVKNGFYLICPYILVKNLNEGYFRKGKPMSEVIQIHFSPTQTTAAVVGRIASAFDSSEQISLMRDIDPAVCEKTDTVIVGMPVFAGRIPATAKQRLMKIKGNQTPAIAVVVYGNRAYEDALLELKDTLEQNGFVIAAAGAFIARHSLFPAAAAGRIGTI